MGIEVELEEELQEKKFIFVSECFLTGTAAEVTPIRDVDARKIGIR